MRRENPPPVRRNSIFPSPIQGLVDLRRAERKTVLSESMRSCAGEAYESRILFPRRFFRPEEARFVSLASGKGNTQIRTFQKIEVPAERNETQMRKKKKPVPENLGA